MAARDLQNPPAEAYSAAVRCGLADGVRPHASSHGRTVTTAHVNEHRGKMNPTIGQSSSRETMRATLQDRYGTDDVLRLDEIAQPTVGDDEVLVQIVAASVDMAHGIA